MSDAGAWDCRECDERQREKRNCRNRKGILRATAEREEWGLTKDIPHVAKVLNTKFYVCPMAVITGKTWRVLKLVNETVDGDGHILHLPFPGAYTDQPPWYRDAVSIVRRNRAEYRREKQKNG